ncbi:MAG: extracellular solute-binding protein [Chloroflexi bacterium]|nr:extracellular solute-binding protein [Chloroflexota bacterium]
MKTRLQWLLASLVILSLLLGACGQPAEAPAAEEPAAEEAVAEEPAEEEAVAEEAEEVAEEEPMEEEVVTIKWLMLNNWPVEGSGFLEEFYKEYPNIQVEMEATTINQLYEAIQVRVGGGAPDPDVFLVNGPMTASYAYRGLLMPLDDVFTAEEKANYYPACLDIGSYDEQFVSAPIHNSTQNLYYNADMFAAAGITPPAQDERWTWEQVTEAAKQLTLDEDGDGTPDVWGFNFEQIERFYQLQPLPLSIESANQLATMVCMLKGSSMVRIG